MNEMNMIDYPCETLLGGHPPPDPVEWEVCGQPTTQPYYNLHNAIVQRCLNSSGMQRVCISIAYSGFYSRSTYG